MASQNDEDDIEEQEYCPIGKRFKKDEDPRKLIVLLDQACLETIKVAKEYQLLNPDRHKDRIRKLGRDVATVRPDITHQCLLMLLDSPLNRAGLLQVYIRTTKSILIEINPRTRIPRTFDRFAGLMVQLLHKLSIHASEGNSQKLLKVIKNPVTRYFPVGCPKIAMSHHADELVPPRKLVPDVPGPTVAVIGAMAHGSVNPDFATRTVSISGFPLSGALACAKLCTGFEEAWSVESTADQAVI